MGGSSRPFPRRVEYASPTPPPEFFEAGHEPRAQEHESSGRIRLPGLQRAEEAASGLPELRRV